MSDLMKLHRHLFPRGPDIQWSNISDDFRDELISFAIRAGIEVSQLYKLVRTLEMAEAAMDDDPVRLSLWSLDGMALDNATDWGKAMAEFRSDVQRIAYEIDHGNLGLNDLDLVLQVQLNWLLFFAARSPVIEDRARMAKEALDLETRMIRHRQRWDAAVVRQSSTLRVVSGK